MEKRFFLFILLAAGAMIGNALVMNWLNPPPPPKPKAAQKQPAAQQVAKNDQQQPEAEKPGEAPQIAPAAEEPEVAKPAEAEPAPGEDAADPQANIEPQYVTLGSLDPADPHRMLVMITNVGAAVERIELNDKQLRELDETSGYLGHLAAVDAPSRGGAIVRAVGKGTPAAKAGLQPGDIITAVNQGATKDATELRSALRTTRPKQQVALTILRDGSEQTLTATLTDFPLEMVGPEPGDPLSLLFTLQKLGDREIARDLGFETREAPGGYGAEVARVSEGGPNILRAGDVITHLGEREVENPADLADILRTTPSATPLAVKLLREGQELKVQLEMPAEIAGLSLRTSAWQVVDHNESQATFLWKMPKEGLEIIRRYRLIKATDEAKGKDYHLVVDVEIKNTGTQVQELAYQLDGPTGLPIEGWWFGSKISRTWSGVGVRDVAVWFRGQSPKLIAATSLLGDSEIRAMPPEKYPLVYAAVDAQYVAAALLPQRTSPEELWLSEVVPIRVGPVPAEPNLHRLVNTSFRLISQPQTLEPGGAPLKHEYLFFVGPKRPELLARYELGELVYYGWFGWVAKPMLAILHFFYALVHNYGLAIIMLTVLVRGCMFPLSRKQAISAQKMQELQPELKKLGEKYKSNLEARNKAQQELFKKHNYNPLGGCGLMFVQLPIFIGLYRSLMVDVELWQAPLVPGLRWCSNLAAPDMLFRWKEYLPGFLASETGWLGPYFNLLPIFTIGLFLWQQKLFMPPPTDEQSAMQQKMIKYMMVFMGVMFFKVAAGLCIYFIASSLWGIAERKLLPKTLAKKSTAPEPPTPVRAAPAATSGNGAAGRSRKKQRGGK